MPKGVDSKLHSIIGGTDFAALDSNTHARNSQFELRIASYFCQSGCEVDMSSETDIIALTKRFAYFVECKRISSGQQVSKRLSEASNQLCKRMPRKHLNRSAYGLIAIDVTKVAFTHNGLTFAFTPIHSKDVVQEKLSEVVQPLDLMPVFQKCEQLLCCLFQIHIPSLVMHPPTPVTRFSSFIKGGLLVRREPIRAFQSLNSILNVGLKRDKRNTPAVALKQRKHIAIPAGSKFRFDEDLLDQTLQRHLPIHRLDDEVIARIEMNGETFDFNFFEFKLRIASATEDEWSKWVNDRSIARLELIAGMLLRRNPYLAAGGKSAHGCKVPFLGNEITKQVSSSWFKPLSNSLQKLMRIMLRR